MKFLADLLRKLLIDKRLQDVSVNSAEFIQVHRKILNEKKILRDVFSEFYETCINLNKQYFSGTGKEIEIGAGSSFFKSLHPHLLSSDIKMSDELDLVVNAQSMPFENNSIRSFYCINCFHHFPNPDAFFNELNRTLYSGGGAILIEPYFGPLASLFYKNVFKTEHFNKNQKNWLSTSENHGAMTGANQALSYIVFFRDKKIFSNKHPRLELVYHRPLCNYLRYFMSGGLNFKSLIPEFAIPIVKGLELFLRPFAHFFALHHIIIIRKI